MQTDVEYYHLKGGDIGNYQFTSLDDIIDYFMVVYVGDQKIIQKASRIDVAFHAQRALAELSFDTFKSIKSQQIDVPNSLVMPIPHDYVNYTKLTWVDSSGIKHPLYPTNRTSNPFQIRQEDDGSYSFPEGYELLINNDFSIAFDEPWFKATDTGNLGAGYKAGLGIDDGILKFSYATKNGAGANDWGHVVAIYQEIDTTDINHLDFSADGIAKTITEGVGTIRFGLSTSIPSNNARANFGTTAPVTFPVSPNVYPDIFDLKNEDGEDSYIEWVGPAAVGSTSSTEEKEGFDVSAHNKVYAVVISFMTFTSGLTSGTSETTNSIDNVSVKNSHASEYLVPADGNETESSTWKNYKSTTPSENNNDDYEDDTLWAITGERYGLDPQHAQVNGSFFIDQRLGKIHFSSNVSGKTIILDYISDSLGTDGEMLVHKFAEDAMYKCITHAIISTSSYGQQLVPRLTKEKFAAIRKAKLRLSNIKLEELTQVLRGKSKWIKH